MVTGTQEDYGVRSSHPQDSCLFFWSLLGLGEEKCKFTSCYVCLASKRKSRFKGFWHPVPLTLGLAIAFIEEKFPTDVKEQL